MPVERAEGWDDAGVYIPAHFRPPDDDAVRALLAEHGAADLITVTDQGLLATLLPFVFVPPEPVPPWAAAPEPALPGPASHPLGRLLGHVARNNDQWRLPAIGESLVIVRGEDAYISPSWYAAKAEHGRVVPTWNYVTAHVYGELVVHDDPAWVEAMVRSLTAKHEGGRSAPWSVDDAPPPFLRGQLRAIVGVELLITRIEAKFKLNQNRSAADIAGVVDGLGHDGRPSFAALTEHINDTGSAPSS